MPPASAPSPVTGGIDKDTGRESCVIASAQMIPLELTSIGGTGSIVRADILGKRVAGQTRNPVSVLPCEASFQSRNREPLVPAMGEMTGSRNPAPWIFDPGVLRGVFESPPGP